jgi:hypothetical protein
MSDLTAGHAQAMELSRWRTVSLVGLSSVYAFCLLDLRLLPRLIMRFPGSRLYRSRSPRDQGHGVAPQDFTWTVVKTCSGFVTECHLAKAA